MSKVEQNRFDNQCQTCGAELTADLIIKAYEKICSEKVVHWREKIHLSLTNYGRAKVMVKTGFIETNGITGDGTCEILWKAFVDNYPRRKTYESVLKMEIKK